MKANPRKTGVVHRNFLLVFIVLGGLLLLGPPGFTQEKKKKKKRKPEYEVAFRLGVLYDDNILKYSEQYLERFMNGEDEGRFHIETYDDAIFVTGVEAAGAYRIFGKRKTVFNLNFNRRTYLRNGIKNWKYFAAGIRQYLPWKISVKVLYSYIPSFYVRHFRDDFYVMNYGFGPNSFTPYIFSKDNLGFWAHKYFFKGSRIRISYYYSKYYHNRYYTDFDSKNHTYGAQFFQRVHKNLRFNIGYYYVTSDAKGYDEGLETPETTNGPDASYLEDRIEGGFLYTLPRIQRVRQSFNMQVMFLSRYYTSEHPWQTDRLHTGRYDRNLRILAGYTARVSKSVNVKLFYNWLGRNSSSTAEGNEEFVSNEKDYKQNIIGMEMIYTLDF